MAMSHRFRWNRTTKVRPDEPPLTMEKVRPDELPN
jgi:hypothetical protein